MSNGINLSNGINKRQNENKSIKMLAAQRQLYNDNKKMFYMNALFSVIIPFSLSLLGTTFSGIPNTKVVLYICTCISFFIGLYNEKIEIKNRETAALIQQQFDVYVFDMTWDDRAFGTNHDVDTKISTYSEKIMNDEKQKDKLMCWYNKEADKMQINDGIIACQRENCNWDSALRIRAKKIFVVMEILPFMIIIIISCLKQELINTVLINSIILFPVVLWTNKVLTKLDRDINRLKEIECKINDNNTKEMNDLIEIQGLIYDHRKNCFEIPNIIYTLCRHIDEYEQGRLMKMSRNKK